MYHNIPSRTETINKAEKSRPFNKNFSKKTSLEKFWSNGSLNNNDYYLNLHDLSTKLPVNHPYNKYKLDYLKFIIGSNNLVSNQKKIYPLINISRNITGQNPSVIKAKRSVASFKLRKNNPIAITTTLRKDKAKNFLNILSLYFLPRLVMRAATLKGLLPTPLQGGLADEPKGGFTVRQSPSFGGRDDNFSLSFGFNNITLFSYLTPLASNYTQLISNLSLPNSGNDFFPEGGKGGAAKGIGPEGEGRQSRSDRQPLKGSEGQRSWGGNKERYMTQGDLEYLDLNKVGGYIQLNTKFSSAALRGRGRFKSVGGMSKVDVLHAKRHRVAVGENLTILAKPIINKYNYNIINLYIISLMFKYPL